MIVTGSYGLDELIGLANSRHGAGAHPRAERGTSGQHDHLATPREARAFLQEAGLTVPGRPPTGLELASLVELRDAVHQIADGSADEASRALPALLLRRSFRLEEDGRLTAIGGGWSAVTTGLLLPLVELARSHDRLTRCQNRDCGWLFVDRSRNRSRQWCDMGACGNRAKASRFRGRSKDVSPLG